jgi:hypothetical protein
MSQKRENFMMHWGKSYWEKALHFPGAKQISVAAKFMQQYDLMHLTYNNSVITPSLNIADQYEPIAAGINKHTYIIYFPQTNKRNYSLYLSQNMSYILEWVSPLTCKKIKKQSIRSGISTVRIPDEITERDTLLIIRKQSKMV